MHQNEASVRLDHLPDMFACGVVRRNGRANGDPTVLGDFRGHIADAPDVNVTMLFRETELGRQMLAH